jgi:surface antigen
VTRPRTRLAADAPQLDEHDEIAALSAIGRALRDVADGSSYVWYRWHGRLSGVVHPTASFEDAGGRTCRHIVVILTTGARTGRLEGIACRLDDGNWALEGS